MQTINVAVLIVSDTAAAHPHTDKSVDAISSCLKRPFILWRKAIVPDKLDQIKTQASQWIQEKVPLILTSGGTGFGQTDLTPEAILPLIERQAPGLVYAMFEAGLKNTSMALLSRPVAGICQNSIIITLPGSPKAVVENLSSIIGVLEHACQLVCGGNSRMLHQETSYSCAHFKSLLKDPVHARPRKSPYSIVSLSFALNCIKENTSPLESCTKKVDSNLVNHIIATDVLNGVPMPAFRASIVDGYAVHVSDGPGIYKVHSVSHAQASEKTQLPKGFISRITTGAPVPEGANAVVMVEDSKLVSTEKDEEKEVEIIESVKKGENIREIGSDLAAGAIILSKGAKITSTGGETGILASIGMTEVDVFKRPRIGVLSTGNEIVRAGSQIRRGQVFDSNRPAIITLLRSFGYEVVDLGICGDNPPLLRQKFKTPKLDVLITTGGVSMGDLDLVKPILVEMDYKIHFGRVAMKPGKPTTFATSPNGQLFFGLPGNPASAIVTTFLFVLPALRRLSGDFNDTEYIIATLKDEWKTLDEREEFVRAKVSCDKTGRLIAQIVPGGQRSSRIASLVGANALLHFPGRADSKHGIKYGETVRGIMLDKL